MQTPFAVRINGSPANSYQFRPAAANITYSVQYDYEQARIYAGMSITEWDALPGTRQWIPDSGGRCKCDLIILYRMSQFIPAAANDAQGREMERKAKQKGR